MGIRNLSGCSEPAFSQQGMNENENENEDKEKEKEKEKNKDKNKDKDKDIRKTKKVTSL
jgi:hypothetical protein